MADLFPFQRKAVLELLNGKHIIRADCGCLASHTPIMMTSGEVKEVQKLSSGDKVVSYDEHKKRFVSGTIDAVIRTSHKPKAMIELEYDGEKIRTTYDHPFFNGEGYYPLYQLIWGALETSQRAQLKLLCKQYGQAFDDKAIWCKHCESNEPCKGQGWLLQDDDGRQDSKSPQNSCRELANEPYKLAMCEPHKWQQNGQQSRKLGMVYLQVQRMVGDEDGDRKTTNQASECVLLKPRKEKCKGKISVAGQPKTGRAGNILQRNAENVPIGEKGHIKEMGDWKIRVLQAEPYYSISLREAPYTYCIGRRHHFITHNTGKSAIMVRWLEQQHPTHIIIATTASKVASGGFDEDFDKFANPNFKTSLQALECVSWHMLYKWVKDKTPGELSQYVFCADECQRCKAGVSSQMGRAFLLITKYCKAWTGYTATPGDTWSDYCAYFIASGLVRNKTAFQREFCIMQHHPFPMVLAYTHEDVLNKWWRDISYEPDSSSVMSQLPPLTKQVIKLPKPKGYDKVRRTSTTLDGEFLESNMALLHELRQMCATRDKISALSDILESLSSSSFSRPCVVFYNYTCEREQILSLAKKLGRKVWRIDGEKHEIPTAETIGRDDIVLCHYLSGSEALNLQFISYFVSMSYNYSYSITKQAMGRIRRVGQTSPQHYYFFKCEGTVEEDIAKTLNHKRDFVAELWQP